MAATNFMQVNWKVDSRNILQRGPADSFDYRVVGDPCIVWDQDINTWRMYYFAAGKNSLGQQSSNTGMAFSKSAEEIGPGDWEKIGEIQFTNREAIMDQRGQHKFWVVMNPYKYNHAAKIDGKYWAVFTCSTPFKYIQAASAEKIGGPWTVVEKPILSPEENFLDGRHCDTPTAYWFEDKNYVAIFYKGYPKISQEREQPESSWGSGTILAFWHPNDAEASNKKIIQRAGQSKAWNQGWMSTPMIYFNDETKQWYGLINGSPTPPADDSHREPAPSLGGWVISSGDFIDTTWQPDTTKSPFIYPKDLTGEETAAGLGVNFWRHHLLVTPGGQMRIFFNSGEYGKEQMYSLVPEETLAKTFDN